MKTVLIVLIALVSLASCTTSNGPGERLPDPSKTKAKLKCTTYYTGETSLQYGDLVIRYVDTLYQPGDHVRFGAHEFEIVSIAR